MKPLSDATFANIFSHSVGFPFTFLTVSSDAQVLNVDEIQFMYFYLVALVMCANFVNIHNHHEVRPPILQIRQLRHRNVKYLA